MLIAEEQRREIFPQHVAKMSKTNSFNTRNAVQATII